MSKFSVEFYKNEKGEKPAKEFILSQNAKMKAKLFGVVDLLEEYGNQLKMPYSKPIGDGIFEIRAKIGSDISRILYFFYYEGRIIMTNGFTKKTQKTPPEQIEKAKRYRQMFLERENRNE